MNELEKFGWSEYFAGHFVEPSPMVPGRVIAEHRDRYRLQTAAGQCAAQISGRLRHEALEPADLPAVGDWVVAQHPSPDSEATIHRVLPRRSKFSRRAAGRHTEEQVVAANIDSVWIVCGLDGELNLRRIERYLTLGWESGAEPLVVLNKADLDAVVDRSVARVESIAPASRVVATSCVTGQGLDALRRSLRATSSTVAMLGSSGVGKSTLINALSHATLQPTGAVRRDGKGRHTTTHRQLIPLPDGGLVVDTPGMRELGLWDGEAGMDDAFDDVDQLAAECRFNDCRHAGEPGCAVAEAIAAGRLDADRLASYQKLERELAWLDRKRDALSRQEETRRIKSMMKTVRKHHPKYKRK